MKARFAIIFVLLAACSRGSSADQGATGDSKTSAASSRQIVKLGKEPLGAALARESAKAKSLGLKPFVELSATWCPPCKALEKYKDDPKMVNAYRGTYVVQIDIDEASKDELQKLNLAPTAIPRFYELDEKGMPTTRMIDGGAWEDDVPANMAPALDKFFHA